MHRAALPRRPFLAVATAAILFAGCATDPDPSSESTISSAVPAGSVSPSGPAASVEAPETSALPAAWERLDDAPFARLEMAVASHDGRIWLAGGLSALGEALSDVDVLDPATGVWETGPALPAGVHHAALVSDGERLLLIGGYLGSTFSEPTELVFVLADGGDAWEPGPALPERRAAGAAAWDGERVVYAGGVDVGVVGDVFTLEGETWTRLGSMARPREHLGAASDGSGRTWLLGGRVGGLDTNLAGVELVDGGTIVSLDPLPTPRGGVAAVHLPGIGACLTGGEEPDEALRTVECIADDGTSVTLPDLLEPHHGHGAAVVDGVAYVLLGGPVPALSAGAVVERLRIGDGD